MLVQSLISIAGIAFIVGVAWLLFRGSPPDALTSNEAKALAARDLTGFVPADALVSAEGRAALVAGAEGRLALVRRHGDHAVVRRLGDEARMQRDGAALRLQTGERMFGAVILDAGEDAALWESRLTALTKGTPGGSA
ncbi:MAG: hypothetical protein V2J26_05160 [Pacificimonas sp.]|jgi:hypothetical protein|nr:hypothetical protein [Pacificimonas sp.]